MVRAVPPRVKADEKRRELVAQAAELFDRAGYHTTSVGELARAVGIQKPTLYHYFSRKDEILFSIHEEFIDLLIERQNARSGLAAAESLREIMGDVLSLMDTHRGHVRVFFEHHRELSPEDQATIARKRDAYQTMVEDVIARGTRPGSSATSTRASRRSPSSACAIGRTSGTGATARSGAGGSPSSTSIFCSTA